MEEYDDIIKDVSDDGVLDISHKNFNEIDETVWDWGNKLKKLTISFNRISEIPPGIANLLHLSELHAACNNLTELCKEIGDCRRLKVLKLNGNQIKSIPVEIGNLRILEEFYLSENEIEELPEEIGDLKSLRILTLQNNQLKEVNSALGECLNMESFDCSNNPLLKNIPKKLRADTSLAMWMLSFQRGLVKNYREAKQSNEELEEHARYADKERLANMRLKGECDILKTRVGELEAERPAMYLKIKSQVCTVM